jgi:hypothetical protein
MMQQARRHLLFGARFPLGDVFCSNKQKVNAIGIGTKFFGLILPFFSPCMPGSNVQSG